MMKTCLINLPHMEEGEEDLDPPPTPLLSVLTLGTILKKNKLPVEIIDLQLLVTKKTIKFDQNFHKEAVKLIDSKKANVLGFTAMCSNYPMALNLARKCKKSNPQYKIVLGGPQATATGKETLESFPFIDIIVYGEGDITLVEVVDRLEKGESLVGVAGISYRDGENVIHNGRRELIKNLDDLPMLDYGLAPPLSEYQGERKSYIASIEVGRGCPYNCTYCSTNRHWERRFRLKSAEKIVAEMIHLKNKYRIKLFLFAHDLFTLDKKKLKQVCDLIIKKKLNITWGCHSRADSFEVGDGTLELMAKAGCIGIFYGIESGSTAMQTLIKKNIKVDKVEGIIKESINNNVSATVSFIIGFPEEKEEDLNDTLTLALKLANIDDRVMIKMGLIAPVAGTEVMEKHKDDMILTECIPCFTSFSSCMEEEWKMIRKHPNLFSVFYNLRTKHLPLEVFVFVQEWGLMLIACLPKSLSVFCRKINIPPLQTMYLWINWLRQNKHEITTTASFRKGYKYFYKFAKNAFAKRHLDFSFLSDILEYERSRMLIKLRKNKGQDISIAQAENVFSEGWEKAVPNMSEQLEVKSFSYDVEKYLKHIKTGREKEENGYKANNKLHHVFFNYQKMVIVKRLSQRTKDIFDEIDGVRTFEEILDRFKKKHSLPKEKILHFLKREISSGHIEINKSKNAHLKYALI